MWNCGAGAPIEEALHRERRQIYFNIREEKPCRAIFALDQLDPKLEYRGRSSVAWGLWPECGEAGVGSASGVHGFESKNQMGHPPR